MIVAGNLLTFAGLLACTVSAPPDARFNGESNDPTPTNGLMGDISFSFQDNDIVVENSLGPERINMFHSGLEDGPIPVKFVNETRQADLCQCGQSSRGGRIVGGTDASSGEIPWRVYLVIGTRTSQGTSASACGGTILSPRWILTAAHCFGNNPNSINVVQVRAGVLNKRSGRVLNFKSFRVHSGYNSRTHLNDVALIELQQDLEFSSTISPACLPYRWAGRNDTTGQVLGSGWGVLKENGNSPDVLMKVILDMIPNKQCKQKLGSSIESTQVCTLTPNKDTCQGDSGGSIDASYRGKYYAFGVVSWGYGCARDDSPGVYARISEYTSWIEQNTGVTNFCKS